MKSDATDKKTPTYSSQDEREALAQEVLSALDDLTPEDFEKFLALLFEQAKQQE